jgi:drug/metabolite transporter (DMT)-like permease
MQVLELIVAMVSAVLLGGESLSAGETIGALMILGATMIEALGTRSSEVS